MARSLTNVYSEQLQHQQTYDHTASARRVLSVDSAGNPVSDTSGTDVEGGGKVAVGTTPVEVTFVGSTETIIITADLANTGTLYVGKADVASDGSNAMTFLNAGDEVILDYDDSTNALYVVADGASQNFWKGALL